MKLSQVIKIIAGPLSAILILAFTDLAPGNPMVTKAAAVACWMAVWWLTEVVNLAVTALLPLVLFPLLGIMNGKSVAEQYIDQTIFLFIGGFFIAFAIKRWNLHERIALKILMIVGSKPVNMLMGVMLTAFLISMWISNTATVMMLLSAVLAIVYQVQKHYSDPYTVQKISAGLLIGLAYSATIGGMATLVGTPTNMIFLREYNLKYPDGTKMDFVNWFKIGMPLSFAFLICAFIILYFIFIRKHNRAVVDKDHFSHAYAKLGKMSFEEIAVSCIFFITALLWFTRSDIDFGVFKMYGWSNLFSNKEYINDSTVAVCMAVLLFFFPSKTEKGRGLLIWQEAKELPIDVILLFGGGFALAKSFEVSGLSDWLAQHLTFVMHYNIYVFIIILCVIVAIISEFASNVASIQLMIPILVAVQKDMHVDPLFLLVPATLAASLGFMLPVATAPNTIVFGAGIIKVKDFWLAGLLLDIIGVLLILLAAMALR